RTETLCNNSVMTSSRSLNVFKWDASSDGPLSSEAMQRKLRSLGYSSCRYTFGPGTVFPDHTHPVDKMDAIVSGRFLFRMFGEEVVLEPGDRVLVPKDTVHYAEVVGSQDVVFFDSTKP
ncbi:hypothetical protein BOX15_Mlig020256g1, partial [Macrostomum lignano]